MTFTLTRYTENMALREQSLEDVWFDDWAYCKVTRETNQRVECLSDGCSLKVYIVQMYTVLMLPMSVNDLPS